VSPTKAITSPKFQNPSSSFAIPNILLGIPNVIDVVPNEVVYEIPKFITIDLDEIVELSNSQFDPQVEPPRKK
jgi:hypothetical protein